MGTANPPFFIPASPKCLAASLREMADLLEAGSNEIHEAEVYYDTAEKGEHLTIYHVVHAPGRAKR
ncbi:hypothetical protein ABEI22_22195 [Erwinia billingiae]|uniref:hypothetical protein n=1 Tax=Erwinia billingiae TaxID=182337 RepID=UPI003208F754